MFTNALTRAHQATHRVADEEGVTPFDIRVVVAVYDRGLKATLQEIAEDLAIAPSAVRRAALRLRAYGTELAAHVDQADPEKPPRPGMVSVLHLTDRGEAAALRANNYYEEGV